MLTARFEDPLKVLRALKTRATRRLGV